MAGQKLPRKQPSASCCPQRAASTMTASYVPHYNYATPQTQIATSHPCKSYLAAPLRAYTPATPSIRSQRPTASQLPTSSADQCPNSPPSVPTLQTPKSTQPMVATPNNPNMVLAPAPLLPLTPARPTQVDSPNLDVQSRDLQLPRVESRPCCFKNNRTRFAWTD